MLSLTSVGRNCSIHVRYQANWDTPAKDRFGSNRDIEGAFLIFGESCNVRRRIAMKGRPQYE